MGPQKVLLRYKGKVFADDCLTFEGGESTVDQENFMMLVEDGNTFTQKPDGKFSLFL